MAKSKSFTDKISKSLGSTNSYAVSTDTFDSTLLNPIPRDEARKDWGISGDEFKGIDVWNCHEATFLTNSGIPVAGTVKLAYESSSTHMIESKSMKLYFNSFDMCKMGDTIEESISNYEQQLTKDLSKALHVPVYVKFHESGSDRFGVTDFDDYKDLHSFILSIEKSQKIEITDYNAKESHICFEESKTKGSEYKFFTNVLRSRCRHTKQKDTGTAYISIYTKEGFELDVISLFKEIVSLREVNEFHEFCAEKLYTAIMNTGKVQSCCISLLYSRRGSLDINPVRCTSIEMFPKKLVNVDFYTKKTQGQ